MHVLCVDARIFPLTCRWRDSQPHYQDDLAVMMLSPMEVQPGCTKNFKANAALHI